MKYFATVFSMVLIAGCTTQPISTSMAKGIPESRIIKTLTHSSSSPANVSIVRDVGIFGSGFYVYVSANGDRIAKLDVGEKIELVVDPGEYVFGVIPSINLGNHTEETIDANLVANRHYYYRVLSDESYIIKIQRYVPE